MRVDMTRRVLLIVLLVALSACSYRVAGRPASADGSVAGGGGLLPGNVEKLAIPFFINNTKKPNVESVITDAMVNEFTVSVDIVDSFEAEAVLLGEIDSYRLEPVSFTATDVVQEYRLHVVVSFTLMRSVYG